MRRRLAQERFWQKLSIIAAAFCFLIVGTIIAKTFAATINNGDKVEENTDLTYYLTVTADGIDGAEINSENGEVASVTSDIITVSDKLPESFLDDNDLQTELLFTGFETTETGSFSAVSQSDHTQFCTGTIVDDTREEGASEGHWTEDGSEYYYHGLHYTTSDRTVRYQVKNLQAGCEITIGIKVKTPTLPSGNIHLDFYNTAIIQDGDISKISNPAYFWMGKTLDDEQYITLTYIYEGTIPDGAPSLPEPRQIPKNSTFTTLSIADVPGYTFSGWRDQAAPQSSNLITYTAGESDIILVGSFTANPDANKYPVVYEIEGSKPDNYVVPSTKYYEVAQTVELDSLAANTIISNYTFNGWTSTDIDTSESSFEMPDKEQVLIKGSFTHNTYSVSYEFAGEAPDNASSLLPEEQEYEANAVVSVAESPSSEDWEFLGWDKSGSFLMPEEDITIIGYWRKNSEQFSPEITKTIVDQKSEYYKDDEVIFEVTVRNTIDAPLHNVLVSEENEETSFLESDDYSIISPRLAEITSIPSNSSVTLRLKTTVSKNANQTITDTSVLVDAKADNYALDTNKDYMASVDYVTKNKEDEPVDEIIDDLPTDTPNTYDGFVKVAVFFTVATTGISSVFILSRHSRHQTRKKLLGIFLIIPAVSFAVISIANTDIFAAKSNEYSTESSDSNYTNGEAYSWRISESADWVDEDTAKLSILFDGNLSELVEPADVMIAVPNDRYITQDEVDKQRAEILEFAESFLQNPNNRIGILSLDSFYTADKTPSTKLAPTTNLEAIAAALDRIKNNEHERSDIVATPLEAAKLILSADDSVERTPVVVAFYGGAILPSDEYGSLQGAKMLLPDLYYNVAEKNIGSIPNASDICDALYSRDGAENADDAIRYDFDSLVKPATRFVINISGLTDSDEFEIPSYATDDGETFSIEDFTSYSRDEISLLFKLKNPNSDEHQTFDVSKNLAINVKVIASGEVISEENKAITNTVRLTNGYKVTVNPNTPESCTLSSTSSIHNFKSLVSMPQEELTCEGYHFKGYAMSSSDSDVAVKNGYFAMPDRDVTINGTWIKSDIKKSMDGEVATGSIAYFDGYYFYQKIGHRYSAKAFKRADNLPEDVSLESLYIFSTDDSEMKIYGWYDDSTNTIFYYTDADKIYLSRFANHMFNDYEALEDISGLAAFDTSKTIDLSSAFTYTAITDFSPIANWDVSNVSAMISTFNESNISDLQPLKNWDVSKLKRATYMFASTPITDLSPIERWNTSSLEEAREMFYQTNIDSLEALQDWTVDYLKDADSMFEGTKITSLSGLQGWNVKNLETASRMFGASWNGKVLTNISALGSWKPESLKNISYMFYNQSDLEDFSALSSWSTYSPSFTNLESTFEGTKMSDLTPLKDWNISSVTSLKRTFYNTQISSLQKLSAWRLASDSADLEGTFAKTNITNLDGLEHFVDNVTAYINLGSTSGVYGGTFSENGSLQNIAALDGWKSKSSYIRTMSGTFRNDTALTDISGLTNWNNTVNLWSLGSIFRGASSLEDISPLASLKTSEVRDMSYAFNSTKVASLLPLQSWNTDNVTDMSWIFGNNSSLASLTGIGGWNVSNVTSLSGAFYRLSNLTSVTPIENWQTNSVNNISMLFYDDANISDFTPLNGWYTGKVTINYNAFTNTTGTLPSWGSR